MAAVIKLSNIIQKHAEKPEVKEYIESFNGGEDWKNYVESELK